MTLRVTSARPSAFAVFRRRNFTLLWIAQFISTIGNGLTEGAASILIYRLTGSAASVGLVLMAATLPGLLVGLTAGVIVDRFDRKQIMIITSVICGILVTAIPVMLPLGVGWLYVLVALSSAVGQFFAPAQASILPETAPDEELASANAMMTISLYGALTVGYAIGGIVATLDFIETAFYLDALSFFIAALCIFLLTVPPLTNKQATNVTVVIRNLRSGLGYVRGTPVLRSLVLLFIPIFVNYGLTNSLILPLTTRTLGGTEFDYSLTQGMFAVGFVIGSLVMARLGERLHPGQWIVIGILGMGLFTFGYAGAGSVIFVILCSTMIGILNAPSYLGRQMLIQRNTPRDVRGRVSSVFFVTRDTGFMLGMAMAGLADMFDVRLVILFNALLLIGCGVLALIMPGLGQRSKEWQRILLMLRTGTSTPGLGSGRAAQLTDIDRLGLHLPALARWGNQERQSLAEQTRVYEVQPGTAIVSQDERSDMTYFLLKGRTVASRAEDGVPHVIDTHSPGDFFGEIAAITQLPRTASVIAEQPTVVLQVPVPALQLLMHDPQINRLFLSKLTERMLVLNMGDLPLFAGLDQKILSELRNPAPIPNAASQ
jgi:MFS family permease